MEKKDCRILVVDDDIDLLDAMRTLLSNFDYNVDICNNVNAALQKVTNNSYDLIVSDIEMPGRNGLEFLEQLKKGMLIEIPVVLMTGHLSVDYAIEAVRLGAADFIKKPIEAKIILKSINHQIIKKKLQQHQQKLDEKVKEFNAVLVFSTYDFLNLNIPEHILNFISKNVRIPLKTVNEISICIEEMVSNAFLHGTLEIPADVRKKSYSDYVDFINTLLDTEFGKRKVNCFINYTRENGKLSLSIQDQGKGFNHERYVRNNHPLLNFDSATGRGLNLIQILSDRIFFSENGTRITIEKIISDNG